MEKQPETPRSPEEILVEKRGKLKKDIDLMLDWQYSDRIKRAIPSLDDLTSDEIDYFLMLVRYLDDLTQLKGPLASTASERLIEDEKELKVLENKIGPGRTREFKNLIGTGDCPPILKV